MRTKNGMKFISIGKLRELIADIPVSDYVTAQTLASTGNLVVYRGNPMDEEGGSPLHMVAIINVWREVIELRG